jgi:RND family efflux transporter MFP subunit
MTRYLKTAGVVLALFVLAGCGSQRSEAKVDTGEQETIFIPVHAEEPSRGDIAAHFETTARVEAEKRVQVLSKGTGLCITVNAEEGEPVEAGSVLVELDKSELEAQVRQSRVSVEQNKTQLQIAERSYREGIGSKVEWDNARFAYEQALATLNVQQVQLDNQIVLAPISGIVTQRSVQKGQFVASGAPVFTIVDPATYILPIMPPERELPRLQLDQVAKVSIDSVQDREFNATVRRINPSVDPMSGTVKVLLDFEEAARPYLREGSFARVRLVMDTHQNVLMVPKDAVIEENARQYVMVVEEAQVGSRTPLPDAAESDPNTIVEPDAVQIARRVEIETGLENSTHIEVTEGLSPGDLVVTLGQHTLKEGSPVTITTAENEIQSSANQTVEEALSRALARRSEARS